jgi:hypothetical protein
VRRASHRQVGYALVLLRRAGFPTLWPTGAVVVLGLHERDPVPEQLARMSPTRIGRLIERLGG